MTTPTASPSTTGNFDPLLTKLAVALKSQYGNNAITQRAKGNVNFDGVYLNLESNGQITTVEFRNAGGTEEASRLFASLSTCTTGDVKDPGSATHVGEQAAATALGHTPTTVKDTYCKGTGKWAGVTTNTYSRTSFSLRRP